MKYCAQCGAQVTGAFCHQCGASVAEDAIPTAGPSGSSGENTWHEVPTHIGSAPAAPYAGYQSGRNPAGYASEGSYPSHGMAGTGSAPIGPPKKSRSNMLLAGLVALVALIVVGLVGFLMLGNGSSKAAPAPSPSDPTPTSATTPGLTPTASPSSTPSAQQSTAQQTAAQTQAPAVVAPATSQTPTSTDAAPVANTPAPTSIGANNNSAEMDGYTATRTGTTVTISDGAASTTLHLNGYRSDWKGGQYLEWTTLPGCSAPILVWNAGRTQGSAAFGSDGSGGYQAFASSGGYDLSPTGGDGSNTSEFGVYVKQGVIAFNDKNTGSANYNVFDKCTGYDLHYARKGL